MHFLSGTNFTSTDRTETEKSKKRLMLNSLSSEGTYSYAVELATKIQE